MVFIVVKYQKCGKENCKCNRGYPHGPYFWLCKYIRSEGRQKRKIKWTYLGRDVDSVQKAINEEDLSQNFSKMDLVRELRDFHHRAKEKLSDPTRKSTSKRLYKME